MESKFRWKVMGLMFLIAAVSYLDRANLAVAAPVIRSQMHFTSSEMGFILSAFTFAYAIAQVPAGFVANRLGPRKCFFYFMWLWCALLIATTTATSFTSWLGFRIPFGAAEAVSWPALAFLMSRWFPRIEYSQVSSIQNLGLVIGSAVAPPLVSAIILVAHWQAAFIITGLMAGLLGTFIWFYLKDDPSTDSRVSQAELSWILHDRGQETTTPIPPGFWKLLASRPSVWACALACFGLNLINFLFLSWYPTYLTDTYQMSMSKMGLLAAQPYVFALVSVFGAGWLVRRMVEYGKNTEQATKTVIFGGLLLGTLCLFTAVSVDNVYVSVTAMSFGYAFVMSILGPMWAMAPEVGGPRGASVVCSIMNCVGLFGGIVSPITMGYSFQLFKSYTPAIAVSASITLICALVFVKAFRSEKDRKIVDDFLADRLHPQTAMWTA
ncbi:MFS transporter [Paraburkholderia phytofirmans]|uniref:MFS transporter n=1 Tax=Paraburkholderia phytofirmans TaxID=261302 RepID=UPI0038BC25E5